MRGYGEASNADRLALQGVKLPAPTPEQLKRDTQQARLLRKALRTTKD
jgi:hypothetical protein